MTTPIKDRLAAWTDRGGPWKAGALVLGAVAFGKVSKGLLTIAAIALVALAAWAFWNDHNWKGRHIEALNLAARSDTTRKVYEDSLVKIHEKLIEILEERDLARLETVEERRTREAAEMNLRAVYAAYVNVLGVIDGETEATLAGDTTRFQIAGRDGPIRIEGPGWVSQGRAGWNLNAWVEDLVIRLRQLEDPATGAVTLSATSTQPQVKSIRLEGATVVASTSVGQEGSGPGSKASFGFGALAGAVLCALLC